MLVEARAEWQKRCQHSNTVICPDFDDLLDAFLENCLSLVAMATELGCSRELMRVIYRNYFRGLFPGKATIRHRQRICTLAAGRARRELAESSLPPSGTSARKLADWVKARGLRVSSVIRPSSKSNRPSVSREYVRIEGHVVRAAVNLRPRRVSARNRYGYFYFTAGSPGMETHIVCYCGPPHDCWFIFTSEEWTIKWMGKPGEAPMSSKVRRVIPERLSSYNSNRGKAEWLESRRERWDLLLPIDERG